MRLCRFERQGKVEVGFYSEQHVVPLSAGARAHADATHKTLELPDSQDLLDFLPPNGRGYDAAKQIAQWVSRNDGKLPKGAALATSDIQLLVPIPRPNKLFLLAGNYAKHIEEGGGIAAERAETFPYVFMKPPTTTLANPGGAVKIPAVSPYAIDWEIELAIVIGREAKGIRAADALGAVAGYTVVNDISNRRFRPNPDRKQRDKDSFFDWLHGKWFDSFCPCGPCITSADAIADPQSLDLKLELNGETRQAASTATQIFPVAEVIEFISNITTLEPGDIISTGTPAGVGSATETFLKAGDRLDASISSIGTLSSPVVAE